MTAASATLSIHEPSTPAAGAVTGAPRALLRFEGLAALAMALLLFERLGGSWVLFSVLFLTPDLSMLGYLAGRHVGAFAYNGVHSYVGAAMLGAFGLFASAPLAVQLALIWAAHIGFDRALGFGLKYASGFGDTHLGRGGKPR